MYAIEWVQAFRHFLIKRQEISDRPVGTVSGDLYLIDEVGIEPSASPNQTRVRGGAIRNRLPFGFQERKEVIAQPVHVIKQDEPRNCPLVAFEKTLYGVRVR